MPDDIYKATMEVTNFLDGAKRIDSALKQLQADLKEVTAAEINFNAKGNATSATLKGISAAGDSVALSIDKIGKSFKTTSASINTTNSTLEKARQNIKTFTDTLNAKADKTIFAQVATQAERINFKNAIVKLEEFAAKNKVSAAQVETIYNNLSNGIVGKYSAALQGVQTLTQAVIANQKKLGEAAREAGAAELKAIQDAQTARRASAAGSSIANSIFNSIPANRLAIGSNPGQASAGEVFNVNKAIGNLQQFVTANRVSSALVTQMWQNVANGVFTTQGGIAGRLQAQLQAVNTAIGNLGNATNQATSASRGFLLSWQSITRFFEARLLYNSISQITGAIHNGVIASIEFGERVGQIRTLTPTGAFDDWDAAIKRVSNSLGTDALDTAKGFYSALSNQIGDNVSQIETFSKTTAEFARVTASSAEQANSLFSSAINSFKLNAADADVIAAKFFKTIDLGRVTAQGLSGSFGRVAAAAGAIGVSLDETLSALALLSKQGVSDSDAMTQLLNIFNKLLKPTDEFKKVLAGVGFSSGEALIATRGFTGVLALLNDELEKGGASAVAKELGDLRAIRGGLSLTGKGFEDYKNILEQVTNSQQSYNRAIQITQETTSFKLQKQLTEIKNAFLSLGQTIADITVSISTPFGGLLNLIKAVGVTLVTVGVVAFVQFKAAAISSVLAVELSLKSLRAVIATVNPIAALAGIAAGILSITLLTESAAEKQQRVYGETLDKLQDDSKLIIANIDRLAQQATARVKEFFTPVNEAIATTRASLNKTFEELTNITQAFNKRITRIAEADFASIDERLSGIRSRISELRSLEARATANAAKDSRKESIVSFEDSIENLNAFERVKARQVRIDELIARASSEQAAKQFQDAENTLELIRQEQANLIADNKEGTRALIGFEKQQLDLKLAKNKADKEQLELKRQLDTSNNQNALRARVVGSGRNRRVVGPNADQLENVNTRALLQGSNAEESTARLNALQDQLLESTAKLNELRSDSRGIDIEKSIADQRQRTYDIQVKIGEAAKIEREALLEQEASIEFRRLELQAQYDTLKQIASITANNPIIGNKTIKTAAEGVAAIQEAFRNLDEARVKAGVNTNSADLLGDIQLKSILEARVAVALQEKVAADIADKDLQRQKVLTENISKFDAAAKNALKSRDELAATLAKQGASLPTSDFSPNALRDNILSGGTIDVNQSRQLDAIVVKMSELAIESSKIPENIGTTRAEFEVLRNQLFDIITSTNTDFSSKGTETISTINNIYFSILKIQDAEKLRLSSQQAINAAKTTEAAITKELIQLQKDSALIQAQAASAIQNVPADLLHKSVGGGIGRGSDRIPALLSPGEFVVNSAASRQFYSQLVSLNGPRGYSKGGSVTNVGDINVNLNSSGNTDVDVNKIGRLLKQQIRRGALSLK